MSKLSRHSPPTIRVVMLPRDTNELGTIFGGIILQHVDLAGACEAKKHARHRVATVAMHEVKFLAPVLVGDLVSFYTDLVAIGTTSITVRVTVKAQRPPATEESIDVTEAEVVYVALDDAGHKVPVN